MLAIGQGCDWFMCCGHVVGAEVCGPIDLGMEELGCLPFYSEESPGGSFLFYLVTPDLLQCNVLHGVYLWVSQ